MRRDAVVADEAESSPIGPAGRFLSIYDRLKRLNQGLGLAACLAIVAIMVLVIWEVITRYFLRFPATWTLPIASYLLLVVIYFSTAYVLQKDDHVRIDFVLDLMRPGLRAAVERVQVLLSLTFITIFFWICAQRSVRIYERWERDISTLNVPLIIPAVVMAVGMGLMLLTAIGVVLTKWLQRPGAESTGERAKLTVD